MRISDWSSDVCSSDLVFGTIRPLFDGPMIYNVGFNRASATSAVEKNGADMVALGQAFIANPDLVERYRNGWTVNRPRVATYYSQGPAGYIDYPEIGRASCKERVSQYV